MKRSLPTGVVSDSSCISPAPEIEARARALFDDGSTRAIATASALTVVEGRCDGRAVRAALTNRSFAGGSFGIDESELLTTLLLRSRDDRIPVVLVLDSAGARLDAGLAGLGAFRRLYRAALDVRLAGVPMVALVERDCFGGASMLAMLCPVRGAIDTARIGMSGPGIVAALSGGQDLDSSDRDAVRALFGAPARARADALDCVFDPDTPRRRVLAGLLELAMSKQADPGAQHLKLEQRLRDTGLEPDRLELADAAALFHRGIAVGAAELWQLSHAVLSCRPGDKAELEIDCPGQAASRSDEQLVLSEYVAHLALCLRERSGDGVEIVMRIDGQCAGGIYVALAAGAGRVEATPAARVRVLPSRAVEVVMGKSLPDETLAEALSAGIADRLVSVRRDGNVSVGEQQ
jgi:acetyl-CoA carboxylase beta subunit